MLETAGNYASQNREEIEMKNKFSVAKLKLRMMRWVFCIMAGCSSSIMLGGGIVLQIQDVNNMILPVKWIVAILATIFVITVAFFHWVIKTSERQFKDY